jgi:hypothetical protein
MFYRYDEASIEIKPYRQKDGALLAIGTLCDKLKQTDPYKAELERMLVQHVFPEFNSHVGHLRAKVESIESYNFTCFLAAFDTFVYHVQIILQTSVSVLLIVEKSINHLFYNDGGLVNYTQFTSNQYICH